MRPHFPLHHIVPAFAIGVSDSQTGPVTNVTVTPQSPNDTIADVARALGVDASSDALVDGRRVPPLTRLVDAGIAHGSGVEFLADAGDSVRGFADGETHRCRPSEASQVVGGAVEVAWTAGPDCSGWCLVPPGRHVIGRASSAVLRVEDHAVELHHLLLDVDVGGLRLTQLSGQAAVRVDGDALIGTRRIELPAVVSIGASELSLRLASTAVGDLPGTPTGRSGSRHGTVVDALDDPWRRVVHRAPEPTVAGPVPIAVPDSVVTHRAPPATGLIGAAVAVFGAGAIAVVLGQMMFALFALFGAAASAITWLVGAVGVWRANRRAVRAGELERQRFLDELANARLVARRQHIAAHSEIAATLEVVDALTRRATPRSDVWRRRSPIVESTKSLELGDSAATRSNGFRLTVGRGTGRWIAAFDGEIPSMLASDVDRAATLDDVAIAVGVRCGEVVAVGGAVAERDALIRSAVCQLAVECGPADWQLVVVSADADRWAWAAWLPHCRTAAGRSLIIDPTGGGGGGGGLGGGGADAAAGRRHDRSERAGGRLGDGLALVDGERPVLLVVDDPSLFAVRTGPLRRFIERAQPATLTCVAAGAPMPAICRGVVVVGSTGQVDIADLSPDAHDGMGRVAMTGLSQRRATWIARSLAGLIDPEEVAGADRKLPSVLSLGDVDEVMVAPVMVDEVMADEVMVDDVRADDVLVARTAARGSRCAAVEAVCRRWSEAGADPPPVVAIGRSADGVVEIDLVADGPHALVAGTTGSGKSELLRTLVVGLALRHSPDVVTFVLVDYKGGSTFDRCADLPHTVGVVTDLDAGLAARALVSLEAELHRRERLLRAVGAADLSDYRGRPGVAPLPRLVVVIDEFAALAQELPEFLSAVVGVAQRGRSLGIHLVLATQRPAGVVSDDIRANTNLRLALRLNDRADALDVVGDAAPADFGRDVPGRVALRLGPDELVVFQAARCTGSVMSLADTLRVDAFQSRLPAGAADDGPTELDVAVAVVIDAVRAASIAPPHRPWIEALPERVSCAAVDLLAETVDHDGVGVIDDPAAQCRRVLRWNRDLGNLALVGSLGSGTTSALRAVVARRCGTRAPAIEHWYVIDARGEAALSELADLPHVGAVVRLNETERLHRVLTRLVAEIDRRHGEPLPDRCVSLAVDGLSSLRAALAPIECAPTLALLDRVLTDGPPVGVASCWTDDGTSFFRGATAGDTWVFRCDDPNVARTVGVTPVAAASPGRLRIASCGSEAAVAVDAPHLSSSARNGTPADGPEPVGVLAHHVRGRELAAPPTGRAGVHWVDLDIGVQYDDLAVGTLRVPHGDHVFIGGAATSGKSTALSHVVAMWQAAYPTGRVIRVDRRRRLPPDVAVLAQTEPGDGRDGLPEDGNRLLIAVDDAERVDDVGGVLARLIGASPSGVMIVAAGRLEAVRAAYGHWTRDVARSRCGLIFTSAGEVDGDLLGATLPRRAPVPARPGLAWLVDGAGHRLVQVVDAQLLDVSPSSQRGPTPY